MGVSFGGFGFNFGYDDTAEYNYKAVKHTNETSTRNLKLQLAAQQQSEMRWMNFQEDQNEAFRSQLAPRGGCQSLSLGCLANPCNILAGLF